MAILVNWGGFTWGRSFIGKGLRLQPAHQACCPLVWSDFRSAPVKSGFNTVTHHRSETLGCIIFTILIKKSEKELKVLRVYLENLSLGGPLGIQTFLQDLPRPNFSKQPLRTFHGLYQTF